MKDKINECSSCHYQDIKSCLSIVPIFSTLSQSEMAEIEMIAINKTYLKGELIYTPGDLSKNLYVVYQGKIKISRISEEGKEQVIRVVGPGDFMGELSLFSSLPMTDFSEAIEKTSICMIDGKVLKDLMTTHPQIMFKIMDELSKRLEIIESLLEDINLHSVEWRLAQYLLKSMDENNVVNLNLTRGYLASYIGMSQETLSRKLSLFEEQGIIHQMGHRKIIIKDKKALKEIY